MSFFANVKCPYCGKEKQLFLGGYGFHGHDNEKCPYCGKTFNTQNYCKSTVSND